ncbi:MAG: isochorismatase family protein [Candidatus Desulfofervidaceae bacterium]|nr:isochorismatase family protein [Candidatus Desulfofervidaceae bacterium]
MFLNREDALVFVVDIQEKLFNVMNRKKDLLESTVKLLKGCQIFDLPIITTEQYPQGLGSTLPQIKPFLDKEKTFSKVSFSGYIPEIKEYLKTIGRKSIILLGIEAHICVWQTCRDLLQNGYQVFVPTECISSRSPIHAHNALELMKNAGAYIVNIETILFDLLKTASASEFKAISQLIK